MSAPLASTKQNDLTLRSIAKRCVSKGGHESRCCPPFETRPYESLLRVRLESK
jgi:hypothetical protein